MNDGERLCKPIFCATDFEVRDLILSGKRPSNEALRAELLGLGVVLQRIDNEEAERELIAKAYADAQLGWCEMRTLLDHIHSHEHIKPMKPRTVTGQVTETQLLNAVRKFRRARTSADEYVHPPTPKPNGRYQITIDYFDINHSQTRLRQRRQREIVIEIDTSGSSLIVRAPSTPKSDALVATLGACLRDEVPTLGPPSSIDVTGINDPKQRTLFFVKLAQELPEHPPHNVERVKLNRGASRTVITIDGSVPVDDDEEENDEELDDAERSLRSAILEGDDVLNNETYQKLDGSGYYIESIRWVTGHQKAKHPRFIIAAALADPLKGVGFHYKLIGALRYSTKLKVHKTGTEKLTMSERETLRSLVESTANKVIESLLSQGSGGSS